MSESQILKNVHNFLQNDMRNQMGAITSAQGQRQSDKRQNTQKVDFKEDTQLPIKLVNKNQP